MIPQFHFATTAVFITLLALLSYFLLLLSSPMKSLVNKFFLEEDRSLAWRMYERLGGAFILGVLPASLILIITHVNDSAILFTGAITRFYLIPVFCVTILIINFFATRKAANRKGYPLIIKKNWTGSLLLVNQLTWAVYLFAYEYLLRGVLFSSCIVLVGLPTATLINIVLYSVLHFLRGIKQMIFAIPFGVVLCLLTVATSSWITAALLHTAFATSYEFFVISFGKKWGRSSRRHPSLSSH